MLLKKYLIVALICIGLLLPSVSLAVIAFDTSAVQATAADDCSWTHITTGDNTVGFVAGFSAVTDAITAITWGGQAMTESASINVGNGNNDNSLWYIIAPPTGSQTIQTTTAGADTCRGASASYTGAQQSGVPESTPTTQETLNVLSLTTSETTVADNAWLVGMGSVGTGTIGAGANTTLRQTIADFQSIADSNGAKSPAGSHSLIFTSTAQASDRSIKAIVASFAPAAAAEEESYLLFNDGF